ncbi:response regulator transcription factor [Streptococcus tangpeifui]|uniref:response regulator transcription factor n=1 Tax=Streptococcus tangpeifui TaxID=2709400 RepID=UPI0013EB3A20|nr:MULTISPECIES: response regulator transcription factor [unclassified Streptococcus]
MLYIYALEDNFKQQARIERAIRNIAEERDLDYEFLVSGKPDQLMESIKGKGEQHIFFLDIDLNGEKKKGFEVARTIRARDSQALIVFVTTHSNFMPLTFKYQVSALDFIDKELPEEAFRQRLGNILRHAQENLGKNLSEDSFLFENEQFRIQMPYSDIYFIEASSSPHKIILHGRKDYMEFYGSLAEVDKATDRFIRVHRSISLNPANVAKVDKIQRLAHFPNGETCVIAKTKMRALASALKKLHRR